MSKLLKCAKCRSYTLKDTCQSCGVGTVNPHPPRFSPIDQYGAYRRMLKREVMRGG